MIAILDIDGTLVDTNYQHTIAWYRAFRQHGARRCRSGGSTATSGWAATRSSRRCAATRSRTDHGDDVRAAEGELYMELIDEVEPLRGRPRADRGPQAPRAHGRPRLSAKGTRSSTTSTCSTRASSPTRWTDSGDVEETKPAPDLVERRWRRPAGRRRGDGRRHAVGREGGGQGGVADGRRADRRVLRGGAARRRRRRVFENIEGLRAGLASTPLG